MKNLISKSMFVLAVGLVGAVALAEAPEGKGKKDGEGKGGPIVRFDTDKDGVLSAEEVTAAKEAGARFVDRADTNQDGQVDAAEIEVMKQKLKDRRGGKPTPEQKAEWKKRRQKKILKEFDADGDGVLNEAETTAAEAARRELIKKYDADGNGQINREERRKMMQERRGKGDQGKGRGQKDKKEKNSPTDEPVIIE